MRVLLYHFPSDTCVPWYCQVGFLILAVLNRGNGAVAPLPTQVLLLCLLGLFKPTESKHGWAEEEGQKEQE